MLLDAVNGFSDVSFNLGNIITIIGGVIATGASFGAVKWGLNNHKSLTAEKFKNQSKEFNESKTQHEKEFNESKTQHDKDFESLKSDFEKSTQIMQANFDREYRNVQEKFIDSQREKRKIREELKKEIDVCHKRTDAVNIKLDGFQKDIQAEIKKVDRELGEIKTGINSIKELIQNKTN
jgi:hypothetical protein